MTGTRDELVTEVIDIYAEPENFPREDASEHAEKILRLIDEAVAARDAEIREALIGDGAVIEAVESIRTSPVLDRSSSHSLPPEGPGAGEPGKWLGHELRREWREYVGRPAIEAALEHIGLDGDKTGGQG